MGPLIALGIGLLPGLIGAMFGGKPEPAPAPPPDNTPQLLKAMQDQHTKDMETINRLIDKLDARDRGNPAQIGLGAPAPAGPAPAGPASPGLGSAGVKAAEVPAGGGPAANGGIPPHAHPADEKPQGDLAGALLGIVKELTHLAAMLTDLLAKLVPAGPAPLPAALTADKAKAAVLN